MAQPVLLDRLGRRDRRGGARREREHQLLIDLAELGVARHPIVGRDHPVAARAEHQRHQQRAAGLHFESAHRHLQPGVEIEYTLRLARERHPAGDRVGDRDAPAHQVAGSFAGRRRDHELLALLQQDQDHPGLDQRPGALGDQLQDLPEASLAADRARDRRRRLEARHGPLELLPALVGALVQTRVLDRNRRPLGEDDRCLLVALIEVAALLLREIEIPPRLTADKDRDPEEAPHLGVPRGKPVRPRMIADLAQS